MEGAFWDFLVKNLGGSLGGSMPGGASIPGLPPSVNIGTHPVQSPAPAVADAVASPTGPITGPTGPLGPEMLNRETGLPVNDPKKPVDYTKAFGALSSIGKDVSKLGAPAAPSAAMIAPQIHRGSGQPMSLIEAVFGLNKKQREEY
jgi:hypothetical protein